MDGILSLRVPNGSNGDQVSTTVSAPLPDNGRSLIRRRYVIMAVIAGHRLMGCPRHFSLTFLVT